MTIVGPFSNLFDLNKFNPTYSALVYSNFYGSIDILMGLFGFVGGGVLMAERGGAEGLFLVVWIYSLWTSIINLFGLFTISQFITAAMNIIILNIITIIIGAVLCIIALANAD
ncbi:MAG: hypothetical protein ACTSRG_16995 [Candidatus Helarchaeota archaeon]